MQVLCPVHRGRAGAGNLNLLLQEALTPFREGAPERRYGGRVFRVGDKVTQLRNNYDKGAAGVFNGTVGVVTAMSLEEHTLTVRTDEDEQVDYGFDELDELAHAYAVTIHRSQGSEYPAVVIPLTTSSWMMLQRNLLYTGVTRAKETGSPGRIPPRPGRRRPHQGRRPPPHRPRPPPPTRPRRTTSTDTMNQPQNCAYGHRYPHQGQSGWCPGMAEPADRRPLLPMSGRINEGVGLFLPPGYARAAASSYSVFIALQTPITA